jgi:hypothetical protein
MWLRSLLKSLKSRPSVATFRHSPHRPRTSRLGVEALGDRCLPSTFTVTNLLDSGAGSLRAAVASANANPGADTIDFATTGTIALTSGKLDITDSLTINGPGASALTVSGNDASRVFNITGSTTNVNIRDLTIAHGASDSGGGIYNSGTLTLTNSTLSNNAAYGCVGLDPYGSYLFVGGFGGGVYNSGTLTLTNSTLSGNGAAVGGGGAIYSGGTLTLTSSTVSNNGTMGGSYYTPGGWDYGPMTVGFDGYGGGLYVAGGSVSIGNCTIAGNGAAGGGAGSGSPNLGTSYGGGMYLAGGTVSIDHSTIAANSASGGFTWEGPEYNPYFGPKPSYGGGIFNGGSTLQVRNTILASNLGSSYTPVYYYGGTEYSYADDLYGGVTSLGHNLIGNSAGGSGFAATDLLDADPQLGPLQDNGGPTKTMGLLAGSPALDAGDATGAPAYDQRGPGFPRVLGSAIDTGAVEGQTQPPPPALVISDVSLSEGNNGTTAFVFTVRLSAPSNQAVSVNYATADGTATAGSDYQATSGTLTIPAGQSTGTITVLVNGDRLGEPNETFVVNLSAPTNATIADGTGAGTIVDDEPRISISDRTVTEGNTGVTSATFTVTLSAAYDVPVTVNYATANGTATAGSDYQAASGTLTFAPGETSKMITTQVIGDRLAEPNETFLVNLSSPTNAVITDGTGAGTIVDDEPRISISDVSKKEGRKNQTTSFTFTVTLSAAYDQAVTMSFQTENSTATTGDNDYVAKSGTLTFLPGQTTKTITIEVRGDSKREADEDFYLDLFGNSSNSLFTKNHGTGTILNDD